MGKLITLKTPRLIVRQGRQADIPAIVAFHKKNKWYHRPFEPTRPRTFYTNAFWRNALRRDRGLKFFLFPKESSRIIGLISFSNMIQGPFQSTDLGYMLDKEFQGQGLMTESLRATIQFVFKELNFHRVAAGYLPKNNRSARVLKRLGFKRYGKERAYLQIEGRWQDHILVSFINPHWKPTKSKDN